MKICKNCKSQIEDDALVCPQCGCVVKKEHKRKPVAETTAANNNQSPKKRRTWLWVLGWIFIFPLPLTILLFRRFKSNIIVKVIKIIIAIFAWAFYLLVVVAMFAGSGDTQTSGSPVTESTQQTEVAEKTPKSTDVAADIPVVEENTQTTKPVESEEPSTDSDPDESAQETNSAESNSSQTTENPEATETIKYDIDEPEGYLLNAVDKYNAQATERLEFVEDFTPSDKNNGHYRTEFRLNAYKDAIGKSYLIGDKVVDIIAHDWSSGMAFRIYTEDASFEQVLALLEGFSPILDESLSESELDETLSEVTTKKTANGYYYGELGITLFGTDENGYELMLKKE